MRLTAAYVALAIAVLPAACGQPDAEAPSAITESPQRIVSLAPHVTELVFIVGAGDKLVGEVD